MRWRGRSSAARRRARRRADRRRPALPQLHRRQVQPRRHPAAVLGARRIRVASRVARAGGIARIGLLLGVAVGLLAVGEVFRRRAGRADDRVRACRPRCAEGARHARALYRSGRSRSSSPRRISSGWCATISCPLPMPSTALCCRAAGTTISGIRSNSRSASCSFSSRRCSSRRRCSGRGRDAEVPPVPTRSTAAS